MGALITVLALTAALVLLHEALRRTGPWPAAGLYLAAPVALTAYWLRVNDFGPFLWIKNYTILFCACYGTALRHTALVNRPAARSAVTVLLALNVLEAVALDLFAGGAVRALNAVAGVVLVAMLPWGADPARLVVCGRRRDGHYDGLSRLWIVGYSVWNWTFAYLNYPELAGQHGAVLLSALLVGLIDPRLWLQARAYTLGAYFIAFLTFSPLLADRFDTSSWSDPLVGGCAAVAALVIAGGCALQYRPAGAGSRLTRANAV
jgi:hypothetical protein